MQLVQKTLLYLAIFLFLKILDSVQAKKRHICPIGYQLAYTKTKEEPICYRKKGPERFQDTYKDCVGNLYTSKLYRSLNITDLADTTLWTEYKSVYSGGPFIDWSYTESTGDLLTTASDLKYNVDLGIEEDLCIVIDPANNFTATSCSDMHFRYCFIKPYPDLDNMKIRGCESTRGYWRFFTPKPACLTAVMGIGRGTVRATWSQAQELCKKRSGSLMNKGWRYSNNPFLHVSGTPSPPSFPLGIVYHPEREGKVIYETIEDKSEVPVSEWSSLVNEMASVSNGSNYGALQDGFWGLVNSSYIFFDVICEKPIQLPDVSMIITVGVDGKIVLTTDQIIEKDAIYCFTDSVTYHPTSIKISREMTNVFILKPIADGYYWCVHIDTVNFNVAESNKALFLREKQSVANQYVVQIRTNQNYHSENLEKIYSSWERKLKEYIFYRTKYEQVYGEILENNATMVELMLQEFKGSRVGLNWRESEVIYHMKIKKLFVDGRTVLLHVALNPDMAPALPGLWDGLELLYMKPAYYCPGFDSVPTTPLGVWVASSGCRNHSCVGDYNDGVQWVTTALDTCAAPPPPGVRLEHDVRVHDVIMVMPTAQVLKQESDSTNSQSSEETESSKRPPPSRPTTTEPPILTSTQAMNTTEVDQTVNTTTEVHPTVNSTTEGDQTVNATTEVNPTPSSTTTVAEITTEEILTTISPTEPSLAPNEQVQQVIEDLESLLNDGSAPVYVEEMNNAFDQVDSILAISEPVHIPSELLLLLDQLGARVQLDERRQARAVRSNVALLVAEPTLTAPVLGMRITAGDQDQFDDNDFQLLTDDTILSNLTSEDNEAVIQLPASVTTSSRRISFVVYRDDRAFRTNSTYSVNSRVLSINVENLTQFDSGEVVDIHLRPMVTPTGREASRACVFWQFAADGGGGGQWARDGCTLLRGADGSLDTCRCSHLTHFAEVLVPRTAFEQRHENALEVLSVVGLALSLLGLLMVALTAILFRSWRRDYTNKIWLQLCLSIFLLAICFMVVVFSKFEEYNIACMLTGVVMHYSVLASFCWMLVAAILSYRRLVIIFMRDASHKLLKASAFSWGAPCAVVGVLLSVDPRAYAGRFGENNPSGAFCYPTELALWLTVYTPIAIMLLANWTLFILIVRSVFASRRVQRHGDKNEAVRCASVSCLLVFLFGLPWIFGLFAFNVVAAYFFTITTTMQGFILFVFFVLGNKKTRDLWLNLLKIKQTRKVPVTSSTYTNRSTENRGIVGNAVNTIESKSSKPRSLSSADDSRFC